jgi:hypothetical protein
MTIINPSNEAALDVMQRIIDDPTISRAGLLQPLLRVASVQPQSFPLLKNLTSMLSTEQLAAQLAQLSGFKEHMRALIIMRQADVPTEVQHEVVRNAAREPMVVTVGIHRAPRGASVWSGPWEQTESELLLRSVEAVGICRGGAESSRQKVAVGTVSDIFDDYREVLPRMVIDGDGASFAAAAGLVEDHPLIVHMWILHLLLGDVSPHSMRRAIDFFRANAHDDYVKDVVLTGDWRATPVFDYLLSRLSAVNNG